MTSCQGGLVLHGAALTAAAPERPAIPVAGAAAGGDHGRRAGAGRGALEAWARTAAPWLADARLAYGCAACGQADHGRPRLLIADREHPGVRVSCTRVAEPEGGWLMLALLVRTAGGQPLPAGFAVGLDAEPRRSALRMTEPAWLDFAFSARERELIAAAQNPGEHAVRTWVLKEALAKAAGTGLRTDPALIDTAAIAARPR